MTLAVKRAKQNMSQEQIYPVESLPACALQWQAGEDYSTGI